MAVGREEGGGWDGIQGPEREQRWEAEQREWLCKDTSSHGESRSWASGRACHPFILLCVKPGSRCLEHQGELETGVHWPGSRALE